MKRFWLKILLVILALGAVDKVIMPLYTSRGKETSVPDVTRMTYQEASRVLGNSRLEAKKSYNVKYLNNVSPDVVIDQFPLAGSLVKPDRNVYLVLNKRERPSFSMPDFNGRTEGEVRQSLARLDMNVGDVQVRVVSNPEENGKVLSQSVPPNVTVKAGSTVSLIVGKLQEEPAGMKRVVVPDLLGMTLDNAKSLIAENGLVAGKIQYERSAILIPNTVISQKPAVNTFVTAGKEVDLTVVISE